MKASNSPFPCLNWYIFKEKYHNITYYHFQALVRFLVLDDDFIGDDFIGQYTIPFECLQSGYRHIPLLNNEGEPLEASTIFVHIVSDF